MPFNELSHYKTGEPKKIIQKHFQVKNGDMQLFTVKKRNLLD